jgi:hypothetical protein
LRRISTLKEPTNSYAAMPTAFVDFYIAPFVVDILTVAEINSHPAAPQCSPSGFRSPAPRLGGSRRPISSAQFNFTAENPIWLIS